jgi:hypothetical protein
MSEPLHIGDTLYWFDDRRRVYDREKRGGPIYREHFVAYTITGETSRSWLLSEGYSQRKASKKDLSSAGDQEYGNRGFFTAEQMEDDIWTYSHAYKISEIVRRASAVQLRKIAEIIGYES